MGQESQLDTTTLIDSSAVNEKSEKVPNFCLFSKCFKCLNAVLLSDLNFSKRQFKHIIIKKHQRLWVAYSLFNFTNHKFILNSKKETHN